MKALSRSFKKANPRTSYQFGNERFKAGIKLDIATRKPASNK